jgi:succinate dehydrogenase / fumarate reductase, cytochrome b subunit
MREFFNRNHFLLRRLHSLTGVVPVGGFLVVHLYANYLAVNGEESYNQVVRTINSLPGIYFLEIFGIILPLYFHALYGIYIAAEARHNVVDYGYGRNWAFFWQRITGIVTLVFVTYHFWQFRFQKLIGAYAHHPAPMQNLVTFQNVKDALANDFVMIVYIIGVVAASYHFFNGLYTFLITWGITIGPRSQRVSNVLTNLGFIGLSALGIIAVFAFR